MNPLHYAIYCHRYASTTFIYLTFAACCPYHVFVFLTFQSSQNDYNRDMRLISAFLWTLAAATQKCTFDECLACTIVDANANCEHWPVCQFQLHVILLLDYPSFKRMCGMISPCCQMQYMEPLKQSVGDFGELAQKKLTETMYQLLHEKTLSGETITLTAPQKAFHLVESSVKNMKSTPMTLVSMDAEDNTDIIFNQPSQKVPLDKKRPTYLHAVMPPQVKNGHSMWRAIWI